MVFDPSLDRSAEMVLWEGYNKQLKEVNSRFSNQDLDTGSECTV
jgi:hypothetical protein